MYTIILPVSNPNLNSIHNIAVKIRHKADNKVSYKNLGFVKADFRSAIFMCPMKDRGFPDL